MTNFTGIDCNGIVKIEGHEVCVLQKWSKGEVLLPKEMIMTSYRRELVYKMLFRPETYAQYVIEDLQEFELTEISE